MDLVRLSMAGMAAMMAEWTEQDLSEKAVQMARAEEEMGKDVPEEGYSPAAQQRQPRSPSPSHCTLGWVTKVDE